MEQRLTKILLTSLLLAAALSLASVYRSAAILDSPSVTPLSTPIPLPTQLYNTLGPDDFPSSVNPLTGLVVADPGLLERRPLAIKISNYPRNVRPQSGLSRADMVYEYYLEQGITRFFGIFYGQDAGKAGPVRSGRFFDEHIFRMYEAIFIFSGADDRVLDFFMDFDRSLLGRLMIEQPSDLRQSCGGERSVPLCRDRQISGYNNLFANTGAASRAITARSVENGRQDLHGLSFDRYPPTGGTPAPQVEFVYSTFSFTRWLYLPTTGRYLRYQDTRDRSATQGGADAPLLDSLTQEVLAADNVIALFVPHRYYLRTATTEIVKIDLFGSGQAVQIRDGQAFPGRWIRPADGLLYLTSPDGALLPLKPGVTFYQVLGETSKVSQEGGGWQFEFQIP